MAGDYRQFSQANWERVAAGWAATSARLSVAATRVTEWLVDRLDCRPGHVILDVAAGTGDTGFAAASRIESGGRLIISDFSPRMIAHARRRAAELGVGNAEFRVLDAEQMDLDDASVDGVVCRFGYMLMADPGAALRETHRVLRRGGRVAIATFLAAERNPWALFGRLLVERSSMPAPQPGDPGIFAMTDPAHVSRLLDDAGFGDVETDELEFRWDFPDFDAYWMLVSEAAGAVADVIAALPPSDRDGFRDQLADRVVPFRAGDGSLSFPAASLVAAATA